MVYQDASRDALPRFCAIYDELVGRSRWYESRETFRFAVLPLVLADGTPSQVSANLHATVGAMRKGTRWYSSLRGEQAVVIAANLVLAGKSATSFLEQDRQATPWFKSRWRFASDTYRSLAVMALWLGDAAADPAPLREADVSRMEELWRAIKKDHPWITQQSDWPLAAVLAGRSSQPLALAQRVEALYGELHRRGFRRGDRLQDAAMILATSASIPSALGARFQSLYGTFKSAGLHMSAGDYIEIAMLCLIPEQGAPIQERVRAHRQRLCELRPKPGRQTSFRLACATTMVEKLGAQPDAVLAARTIGIVQILQMIQAQRAAMAGGAAAAAGAS